METWGSWKFSDENEHLLADVIDKFKTDQCSLSGPREVFLSSLASSSKARVEISSSSSDDSDVERDFNNAVQTCFPKSCSRGSDERKPIIVDEPGVPLLDTFDSETYSQSQLPVKNRGNTTKAIIIEMLNAGDCDAQELGSWLKSEEKNGKDVSEIIGEVWPEIVTDEARHGLCEALVDIDVKPHFIFEQIYLPWFKTDESNLTGFIESLSKLIVHFPEYACKSFLVELLKDKESILVKHVDWLSEIMRSLERQHWCTLLSEYMQQCVGLDQYQIPVMMHFLKNCNHGLSNEAAERLVVLCKNTVHKHSANRDFALFLVCVIEVIDLSKFRPEIDTICGQLKGASKFLIKKALKDAK